MAGFSLVDAGEGARIVAGDQNHPAPRPRPGQMEQKIGGDIDAVLLHHAEGAEPREGGRRRDLHGHLFVGGPFYIELSRFRKAGKRLDDLRGRRAGITGGNPQPGLQGAAGDGLVPHQQDLGPFFLFTIQSHPVPPRLPYYPINANNSIYLCLDLFLMGNAIPVFPAPAREGGIFPPPIRAEA